MIARNRQLAAGIPFTLGRVDDALRAELARRVEADQAMRRAWPARLGDPVDEDELARLGNVDEDNTAWLRGVVAERGWPGRSLVGDEGAHDAWLLAQHADHDRGLPSGMPRPVDLYRRRGRGVRGRPGLPHRPVLRAHGEPQLYGTQFWRGPGGDGELQPQPIADPDGVDERRAAVGLGPIADHQAYILDTYG